MHHYFLDNKDIFPITPMGAIRKLHGNAPVVFVKYNFDLFNASSTQDKVLHATDHVMAR